MASVERIVRRSAALSRDFGVDLADKNAFRRYLEENPINAWVIGKGTDNIAFFTYENGVFRSKLSIQPSKRPVFQELVREIADWRLAEYLERAHQGVGDQQFVGKVSHSGSNAMIFLPDRETVEGVPFGWTDLLVDGETLEGNFLTDALNVVRRPGEEANMLPEILRKWFGPDAGMPGTRHQVVFEPSEAGMILRPVGAAESNGLTLWEGYARQEIPGLFGLKFNAGTWGQHGFILQGSLMCLLVTLDKSDLPGEHRYSDRFLTADAFEWQSQNQTTQASSRGQAIRDHQSRRIAVHLFVRKQKKIGREACAFCVLRRSGISELARRNTDHGPVAPEESAPRLPRKILRGSMKPIP